MVAYSYYTVEPASTTLELPSPFVSNYWLSDRLGQPDLRILDVRERALYADGHLPGAIWLDRNRLRRSADDRSVLLAAPAVFAALMGRLGIHHATTVIVYDDVWGMHAARVVWALARYGHQRAAVLSGGAELWQQRGGAIVTSALRSYPQIFVATPESAQSADMRWLTAQRADPRLLLLDVRAAHAYAAGHLPGAQHWEWNDGVPVGRWEALRPQSELRAALERAGITADRRVVTYCATGSRAAHSALMLRSLGYPEVRVLDDAWQQWVRRAG
jgi:thiosulfate/3-mercaptopyruvate sulfurtransferase